MSSGEIGSDLTDTQPMGDTGQKTASHSIDPVVWQNRLDTAYKNQLPMFKKWAEYYKLMYAIKTYKNIGRWRSKAFIPVMSYKAWTIIAKLLALQPGFSVKIYDKVYSTDDALKIQKANLKLAYDYDNPFLDETIRDRLFDSASDAVIVGTGFGKADWCTGTRKYYEPITKEDGTPDYSKETEVELDHAWNDLDPINSFDVFVSPGGRSIQKKAWVITKYRKSRAELLSDEYYDSKIIDALVPTGKQKDRVAQYKQARNRLIGTGTIDQETIDDTVDSFDVYECYEKTEDGVYLTCFAEAHLDSDLPKEASSTKPVKGSQNTDQTSDERNIWVRIRDVKQPYWHGMYPIVPFYIRRRPHDMWGESIFEVTESMANAYNDIFNQYADNLNIVGNGGILMHDTSTTIYDFYYAPGGEVRYSGTLPTFESPTQPPMEIFNVMMNLLEKGIEWGTISNYATGTPSSSTDKTQGTATGIMRLQEAAGEIATFMKSNFMQSLKMTGTMWLSNNRQFLDDPLALEMKKGMSSQAMTITSDDFLQTMVVTIDEDSMQPATPDERVQKTVAWLQQMFAVQNQSFVQAGIAPVAKGMQPVAPPLGADGTPSVKPIYYNLEAMANEVSTEFGKPDFDTFLHDPAETGEQPQNAADMIAAIRAEVDSGNLEPAIAQLIIDQLEGRSTPNAAEQTAAATDTYGDTAGAVNPPQPTA